MHMPRTLACRRIALALATCGLATSALLVTDRAGAGRTTAPEAFDPLFSEPGRACGPVAGGQPALLKVLIAAKTETAPFQPAPMSAAAGDAPLYGNLGKLHFAVRQPQHQGPGLLRPGAAARLRLQPCRGAARVPGRRSSSIPTCAHVLLGRGAGARPEHQCADDAGGQCAGARRAGAGGGAEGQGDAEGAGADRGAGAGAIRPTRRPTAPRSTPPMPTR